MAPAACPAPSMRTPFAVVLLAAACGSGAGAAADGGLPAAHALFEVPRGGVLPADFFALPFPNDLRLKADGLVDLSNFPGGRVPGALAFLLPPVQQLTKRWSTHGPCYFRFSAAIDPSTLPANVFLADVDPGSPARGTRFPLQIKYYATATVFVPADVLAIMPVAGIVLRPSTRYAAVVTRSVKDARGAALASPVDFEAVKALAPAGDGDVEKARAIYAPAFDELERQGVARADVAAMAVFTTQDPTVDLATIRAAVRALPEPDATGLACDRQSLYVHCTGAYEAPSFRTGTPPYATSGGILDFDAAGNPVQHGTEIMQFTLTLPLAAPASGKLPIALVAHGTGGSRDSILGADNPGDALAARGIAAIGIDQPLHGARDTFCPPGSRQTCEAFYTFNPANLAATRDNFRAGAADDFQLLRVVKRMTLGAALTGYPADVHFDADNLLFFGHSQGGFSGALFLAIEPEARGAVLSGAGGGLAASLLLKTQPVDIKGEIESLLQLSGTGELDDFHPVLAAAQSFLDAADPLDYGGAIVHETSAGHAPKNILMIQGIGDHYVPDALCEALAAAIRVSPTPNPPLGAVAGLTALGVPALSPPISGNATVGSATVTAVLAQYPPVVGEEGHFVYFWNVDARGQYGEFLRSLVATGTATFVAPGTP
ncbi:MAG TPA: Ig-like domain-containing protein [Haliangiales bacterium]|nr:Ig-like domain-containing protein [Haliangiales bacterium]